MLIRLVKLTVIAVLTFAFFAVLSTLPEQTVLGFFGLLQLPYSILLLVFGDKAPLAIAGFALLVLWNVIFK